MSTFSEKIRILRKNREWTQAQLAEALSVSESTVQKCPLRIFIPDQQLRIPRRTWSTMQP